MSAELNTGNGALVLATQADDALRWITDTLTWRLIIFPQEGQLCP